MQNPALYKAGCPFPEFISPHTKPHTIIKVIIIANPMAMVINPKNPRLNHAVPLLLVVVLPQLLLLASSLLAYDLNHDDHHQLAGKLMTASAPAPSAVPDDYDPCAGDPPIPSGLTPKLTRKMFPPHFVFGTATSSYQIEGAANKSCRGPSIWDRFTHKFPDRIADGTTGDQAINSFEFFEDDINRMKAMNMEAYRFSISWSRVIPHGKRRRGLSTEGLEFYDKVIDRTIAAGMKPYVTIFHWDTPQALVDEYGGFLSRNIVDDFRDYADLLFERYGDKVEKWITLNEPWTYVVKGFEEGVFAPGRCSDWVNRACQAGDSAVEPYRVAHHLLLAHAEAVKLYREKYQFKEGRKRGEIGITLVTFWFKPYSDSQADTAAAERAMDFMFGWFMNPVTYGHYPRTMKDLLGQRLPEILAHEADMLRNSYDFLGLNYYTTYYAKDNPNLNLLKLRYATDSRVIQTPIKDGKPIGEKASSWLYIYPEGIRKLLSYTKRTYGSPIIYITENGVSEEDDPTTSTVEATNDKRRIKYYHKHLHNVLEANKTDKVDVRGYFAWSYADNFEWADGYTSRFGLYYIDFQDPKFARIPKSSACWFKRFLQTPSPHASQDNDDQELILLPVSGIANRALPRALRFSY